MSSDADSALCTPEAFFLPGVAGRIYAVYFPPNRYKSTGESVLVVPPFAEEMMRVRRMMSLQARKLSAIGIGTLILDLFGTGDSEGEFCDARWDIWRSDVGTAVNWLKSCQGEKISLLGIRLGALLAMDFVQRTTNIDIDRTVLWNPVANGEKNLRDFLLLRVLAGMMQKAMPRVSLDILRNQLADGESVEVAGYELSPTLAGDMNRLQLGLLGTDRLGPIHWIELSAPNEDATQSLGQKIRDDWNNHGILTKQYTLSGFPFWAEWNTRVISELLDVTTQIFAGD